MLALLEFATSTPWRFFCTIILIEAVLCPITSAISALGGRRHKEKGAEKREGESD